MLTQKATIHSRKKAPSPYPPRLGPLTCGLTSPPWFCVCGVQGKPYKSLCIHHMLSLNAIWLLVGSWLVWVHFWRWLCGGQFVEGQTHIGMSRGAKNELGPQWTENGLLFITQTLSEGCTTSGNKFMILVCAKYKEFYMNADSIISQMLKRIS